MECSNPVTLFFLKFGTFFTQSSFGTDSENED